MEGKVKATVGRSCAFYDLTISRQRFLERRYAVGFLFLVPL
ncbi:MAG: hypothetical protein QGI68_19830 [Pseudomonadales bacterium]|jgi:hypothetical protein|nr:hypothetical protein [Pseudomonadales bacterium]MDP7358314.1 hypothetical protein [Pseudomonadales bacterium]MDP7597795.1 hypothetical protein [Pseudomonadales bacterium]HJN52318.1 hypothetical protein [Pseudomonadales bacterium]